MKSPLITILFFLFFGHSMAQSTYSGNVIDAWDKKYLEGVEVAVAGKEKVVTNQRGYFSIKALLGDTLIVTFPGYIEKKLAVGEERFFLLEIQDRARLLPTFQVNAEPYRFRFKDGKLTLIENEENREKKLSQQVGVGPVDPSSGGVGLTIYGPISYFTKRNTQLRKYEERLEWIKRRAGYLQVIDSDSIRQELMNRHQLNRSQWDELIIRFNEFHRSHEFLDWSKERVLAALSEFFRIESYLGD